MSQRDAYSICYMFHNFPHIVSYYYILWYTLSFSFLLLLYWLFSRAIDKRDRRLIRKIISLTSRQGMYLNSEIPFKF